MSSYKVCPQCKTSAPLAEEKCWNCGRIYQTKFEEPAAKTQMFTPPTEPRLKPPSESPPAAPQMQYAAPAVSDSGIQFPPGVHKVGMVALCGFLFTGAGQFGNHQWPKGFLLLGAAMWAGFATFDSGAFGGVLIWFTALIDAVLIANRLNRGERITRWQFF